VNIKGVHHIVSIAANVFKNIEFAKQEVIPEDKKGGGEN